MVRYQLDFTVPSPGKFLSFMEFSPSGRFLALGDRVSSVLYILDSFAGYHTTISAITLAKPTALVWETSKTFYVGSSDGRFTHYQINLRGDALVQGAVNSRFYGQFPITSIALNTESKILVLSVGPDVFLFRRINPSSMFHSLTDYDNKFTIFEANSTLLPKYQTTSISKENPGTRLPHSQDRFFSPPTIWWS